MDKTYNYNLQKHARNLRKNMTRHEVILWRQLRGRKVLGVKFLRQKPILNYILDFYSPQVKIAIELDGSQHYEDAYLSKDRSRDEILNKNGILTLRYSNNEILNDIDSVMEHIYINIQSRAQ